MTDVLMVVAGYFCGAVPFGVLIARAKGVDPFTAGSGNVGATNIGRLLGKRWGFIVFFLDFLKGLAPTALAVFLRDHIDWICVATALATILGHMFSPFLGLRGGKGVATGAGAVVVLMPVPAGLATIAFLATILAGCTMSLASIAAACCLALAQLSRTAPHMGAVSWAALMVAALVIWRHRTNIVRISTGSEPRLKSLARLGHWTPALHATALALWFGAGCFFSFVVGPKLFTTMKQIYALETRPDWLSINPIAPEIGTRLAGAAIAPMFPIYFALQAICATVALGTALGWLQTRPGRLTRWRVYLLLLAALFIAVGWPISRHVSALRLTRFDDETANAAFAVWHGISLACNFAVLSALAPAVALAGYISPMQVDEAEN